MDQEDSAEEKLRAFGGAYASNFISNKSMAPLMLRELASDGTNLTGKTRTLLNGIIEVVDSILEQGRRTGGMREVRTFLPYFMIVGSMNIFTSTQKMRKTFQKQDDRFGFGASPEKVAAELADIILNGLKIEK